MEFKDNNTYKHITIEEFNQFITIKKDYDDLLKKLAEQSNICIGVHEHVTELNNEHIQFSVSTKKTIKDYIFLNDSEVTQEIEFLQRKLEKFENLDSEYLKLENRYNKLLDEIKDALHRGTINFNEKYAVVNIDFTKEEDIVNFIEHKSTPKQKGNLWSTIGYFIKSKR